MEMNLLKSAEIVTEGRGDELKYQKTSKGLGVVEKG